MTEERNKGGRPRKYPPEKANALACAAHRAKKAKKMCHVRVDLDIDGVAALNSLKGAARQPNRNGKIISKALVFYARFRLRGKG